MSRNSIPSFSRAATAPAIRAQMEITEIQTTFTVLDVRTAPVGGELLDLHVAASATRADGNTGDYAEHAVLDWRLTVWCAS